MTKIAWIDNAIERLEKKSRSNGKFREKLIDFLKADYQMLRKMAQLLEVEGKHLAYDHLRKEVIDLAEVKRQQAQVVRELINELQGQVSDVSEQNDPVYAKGNFREIFAKETLVVEMLTDHANLAEDYGYAHVARQLREIKEENYRSIEQLERVIMRVNTEI